MVKAIYGGTFDPITSGHMDIIHRSIKFCDELVIAIGINPAKTSMFTVEERIKQINLALVSEVDFLTCTNIKVTSFQGLLVDYAKEVGATVLIRGIRSVSDFEYEINLANVNKTLTPIIETVFLPTSPQLAVVSSSMVKEVAKHGADINRFVPKGVAEAISSKFGFIKTGSCDNPSCDGTCNGLHSAREVRVTCAYPDCNNKAIGGKRKLTMCRKHQPYPATS